jgi:hypothetical protein
MKIDPQVVDFPELFSIQAKKPLQSIQGWHGFCNYGWD